MPIKNTNPMHPGKVLESVFMEDSGLNQSALARKLRCAPNKINEIVNSKRSITAEFALQLEDIFSIDANIWVRMQAEYDLWEARKAKKQGKKP